jgi:hypothetical protein
MDEAAKRKYFVSFDSEANFLPKAASSKKINPQNSIP